MAAGDLLITALPVLPLRTGAAPNGLGVKWHGLLFRALHRFNPALADALHNRQRKPFAIAPLLDAPEGGPVASVREGDRAWLRVSCFDAWLPDLLSAPDAPRRWLIDVLLQDVLFCLPDRLPMRSAGPSPWDFLVDRRAPPVWMRRATFDQLAAAPGPYPDRWRIAFRSPTTFRLPLPARLRGAAPDLCLPLPDPDRILRGLASAWQEWAPPSLTPRAEPERVDDLIARVELADHHTTGVRAELGMRESHAAFTGEAILAYRSSPGEPVLARDQRLALLAMLLGLIPYAGIGSKTARGLGYAAVEALE